MMIKGYIFDYGGTLDTGGHHWGKVIWQKLTKVSSNVAEGVERAVDKFYTSVTEEVNE